MVDDQHAVLFGGKRPTGRVNKLYMQLDLARMPTGRVNKLYMLDLPRMVS